MMIPFIAIILQSGLVGYDLPDWVLEWLARVRAWVGMYSIAWTLLVGISLFGHQFTSYLALAQVLQAPLYSCDAKLAKRGHNAEVHLLAQRRDQPMCGSRLGRTRAYPCLNRRSCADT